MSKVIFLDLDGTLTDAGPGIKNCFNYALERMGLPEIRTNNDWIVGPPLWDSFPAIWHAGSGESHPGLQALEVKLQSMTSSLFFGSVAGLSFRKGTSCKTAG